jgi:hypothetical protein
MKDKVKRSSERIYTKDRERFDADSRGALVGG